MGNICRSPTAEGVFRALVDEQGLSEAIHIDSAGTHAYHVGNPPDTRSMQTAQRYGFDLSKQRARRVCEQDFLEFDYILAMDQSNLENLYLWCHPDDRKKLELFLVHAPECGYREVPDPYYGGDAGFDNVIKMIQQASAGLLQKIREEHAV